MIGQNDLHFLFAFMFQFAFIRLLVHWNVFLSLLIIYICFEKTCCFDHVTVRILVVIMIDL